MISVKHPAFRHCRYFCLALVTLNAQAASFDCAKASGRVEQEICRNLDLSNLDDQMAKAYRGMMASAISVNAKQELRASQRQWLANRNRCTHASCLVSHYQDRLAQLRALEAGATSRTPGPVLTPDVVWNQGDAVYRNCRIPDFDCVMQLMRRSGASPEAMAFVRREQAWVVEFTEYGNTDLLLLETFRANTNQFYALASQAAGVIHAEGYDFSEQDKQRPEVRALLAAHPQAFFIARPSLVGHEVGPDGVSRFVFQDTLAECRACEPLARGDLVYEFDREGRFIGVKLGGLKPL